MHLSVTVNHYINGGINKSVGIPSNLTCDFCTTKSQQTMENEPVFSGGKTVEGKMVDDLICVILNNWSYDKL